MQNKEPFVPNVIGLKARITKIVFSILLLGILTPAFSQNEEVPLSKTTLQLLHAADMEGGIEALENAPRFSSVLNALKAEVENTVIIGAGDSYIPGPFFAAANNGSLREVLGREGSGRADILMLNAMGFMAGALGNHEFDAGTGTLGGLIAADRDYVGTAFPFLSANLDFGPDSNLAPLVVDPGQEASTIPNSITKSVVITTPSGEKVGVVGMTTPLLGSLSLSGNVGIAPTDPNDMAALAAIIQESVDALTATGINKIILTGHLQQITLDETIAMHLQDVDIIIAGGSNTLLADGTDRLHPGDTADRPYPILTQSATNEPIAIVGTDGNYRYVGRLVVDFDAAGVLIPESIDATVSGAFVTDEQGVADTGNAEPAARVVEITEAVRNGDATRTFRMVTITFLVDGGDDYPYANFPNTNRVDLTEVMTEEQSGGQATFADPGTEQDALAEYLAVNFSEVPFAIADVGPESDERIQNLEFRADSLIMPMTGENVFNIALSTGLNMIGLPLMPSETYTARSLLEKIGATTVVEYNSATGRYMGFTANSDGNGFPIEGGKGYIVNVTAPKNVSFIGSGWQNTVPAAAAAPTQRLTQQVWAFVLRAQLEGISGVELTVYNGHTRVAEAVDSNNYHAAWADMNRQTVVSAGDTLTIEVRDTTGALIRTLQHEISVIDIHRAFTEIRLTPSDLIPKSTVLLANYPNPFNPETWLPYQLANDAEVTIRIYSAAGHLVRHLDLGFQQAGYYIGRSRAAYWDGRNDLGERLASGVYFYELSTGESSETIRKMVIRK